MRFVGLTFAHFIRIYDNKSTCICIVSHERYYI